VAKFSTGALNRAGVSIFAQYVLYLALLRHHWTLYGYSRIPMTLIDLENVSRVNRSILKKM